MLTAPAILSDYRFGATTHVKIRWCRVGVTVGSRIFRFRPSPVELRQCEASAIGFGVLLEKVRQLLSVFSGG